MIPLTRGAFINAHRIALKKVRHCNVDCSHHNTDRRIRGAVMMSLESWGSSPRGSTLLHFLDVAKSRTNKKINNNVEKNTINDEFRHAHSSF